MTIQIRDFETFDDFEQCMDVQRVVWEMPEQDVVPAMELVVLHRYGGVSIGAFDGEKMVGFVCGIVARQEGRVFHHSHMVAVVPDFRGRGLGEKLKWAQRDRVLSQGMDLVTWTFDPLQAPNANLNINRLGVVIRKYILNLYGESVSPLHGGIPTDRFEVEWILESRRVNEARKNGLWQRSDWEELPIANRTRRLGAFSFCGDSDLDLDAKELLVEIPPNITRMMAADGAAARDWRMKTRRIFQNYLDRGYAVMGFHRAGQRAYYRLERE